jgi:threonine/homoserine/homoserine lactone efflux protein
MKPHRFDPLSFVFGLLFLGVTMMAATGTFDFNGNTLTWLGAGVLLFIGVLMLAGSRGEDRRRALRETIDEE